MGAFTDMIQAATESERHVLASVLATVQDVVPDAVESTSYGVAALRLDGRPLLGVARTAKGLSLYPFSAAIVTAVAAELPGHDLGKGTIRFTCSDPIPDAVLRRIVQLRVAEIEAAR